MMNKIKATVLTKTLSRLSLGSRLAAGFIGVMILFLIAAGLGLLTLISYQSELRIARNLDQTAVNAQNLFAAIRSEGRAFSDILIREDISEETDLVTNITSAHRLIDNLLKAPMDQAAAEQLNQLVTQHDRLEKLYSKAIDSIKNASKYANKYAAATITWSLEIQPVVQQAEKSSTTLFELLTRRANQGVAQADNEVNQRETWAIVGLVLALFLGSFIAVTTIRANVTHNIKIKAALGDLQVAHQDIGRRQKAGEEVSQEVLGLAAELKSSSHLQAEGSHEQVRVIAQINASVTELSASAHQIAQMTEQVSRTTGSTTQDSQQIEETATHSVAQSEKGSQAISRTVEVSQEVAQLYQQLVQTMQELNDKTNTMTIILDLLGSIASETHLLSLNAAIEAAGAGEAGERFMVVAHEVKELAARSSQASKEVVVIVNGIEDVARQAVQSAEVGFSKAQEMKEVAGQAGEIIQEMRQISQESFQQAASIRQAAQLSQRLTDEIREATIQQSKASALVLETLTNFTEVAKQGAEGSKLVSWTANNLEKVSLALKTTLAA